MAYNVPTVDEFVTMFPEFGSIDEEVIAAAIVAANRSVDNSWTEGDFKNAILFLTAHNLQVAIDGIGGGGGEISSESLGQISVSYSKTSQQQDVFSSTAYGSRYLELLNANHGAPVLIV